MSCCTHASPTIADFRHLQYLHKVLHSRGTRGRMIILKLDFLLLFSPLLICNVLLKPLTSNLDVVVTKDQRPRPSVPQLPGLIISPTSTHGVLKRNV